MKYDPNVYGYVNGKPTYSRDEFIFTVVHITREEAPAWQH